MTRDRLPDLLAKQRNTAVPTRNFLRNVHVQIARNKKLNDVLAEAEYIRNLVDVLIENIVIVNNLHNNVLSHTNQDIQTELENRTFTISRTAHRIQNKLRDMGKEISPTYDITIESAQEGSALSRIKVFQYTTILKSYLDVMRDHNESLERYQEKCSSLLHQQRLIVRRQISSEELQQMMDAHETSLFVDNILANTKVAQQQLSDIQSRHNEILKIEKSIRDLVDIFREMAFLIAKQSDQINTIERFASKATDNVDSGRTDLRKADSKKQACRKRKLNFLIVISVIILILLIILIAG